ncbi:MAG: STM4015 family protein [Polyangia bacterium]
MTNAPRRFEMVEGSSSKFWQISVEGASYTVTYGRIGTAGTSKTTACASPDAAKTEADKLIAEKLRKGYSEPGGAAPSWKPPAHVPSDSRVERFLHYKVTGFDPEAEEDSEDEGVRVFPSLRDLDKRVFRIGIGYEDDESTFIARLDALLADKRVGELKGLVIGQWFGDYCRTGPKTALVDRLIAGASKLTSLKGLFVGDIYQEECEISWIHQCDYGPLLAALPQLEELMIRGGTDLRFTKLSHASLRSLTVQTGGLPAVAVRDIASASLPSLKTLTLWLGTDDYGGNSSVKDLKPILEGKNLPALEHLGLQDSEYSDDIAKAVAKSPILGQLKGLDLSMGTLSDVGAEALLASPAIRNLKHLNLRHHYLSPEMMKRVRDLGIPVHVGERRDGEDGERYVEVSE